MKYEIECYIETINSDGNFSIYGAEGFCLEKGGKTYNILWPEDSSNASVVSLLSDKIFSQPKDNVQNEFLLLISAKTNHSKVKLVFDKPSEQDPLTLTKMSLI